MTHYLQLQVSVGKTGFDRLYIPLVHEDETKYEAVERWLDGKVAGRQRNIAKARAAWEARIEQARIARPTSWYREHQLGAFKPHDPAAKPRRRRR